MRAVLTARARLRRLLAGLLAVLLVGGLGAGPVTADAPGHCALVAGDTSEPHHSGQHGTGHTAGDRFQAATPDCSHCTPSLCRLLSPCGANGSAAAPVAGGVLPLDTAWSRLASAAPAELRSTVLRPPTPPPQLTA